MFPWIFHDFEFPFYDPVMGSGGALAINPRHGGWPPRGAVKHPARVLAEQIPWLERDVSPGHIL